MESSSISSELAMKTGVKASPASPVIATIAATESGTASSAMPAPSRASRTAYWRAVEPRHGAGAVDEGAEHAAGRERREDQAGAALRALALGEGGDSDLDEAEPGAHAREAGEGEGEGPVERPARAVATGAARRRPFLRAAAEREGEPSEGRQARGDQQRRRRIEDRDHETRDERPDDEGGLLEDVVDRVGGAQPVAAQVASEAGAGPGREGRREDADEPGERRRSSAPAGPPPG